MTNQEFWNQLEICAGSEQNHDKIPPLLIQAKQENLSLLVVVMDNAIHALEVGNKNYVHCVTNKDVPIPLGCTVLEIELKGLFFSLIESGLNGLCFSTDKVLVGFEWKDLFGSNSTSHK